jgi:hypothetical protein
MNRKLLIIFIGIILFVSSIMITINSDSGITTQSVTYSFIPENSTIINHTTNSTTNLTTNKTIVYGGMYAYVVGNVQVNNQYPAYAGYPFNNTTAQPMPQQMYVVVIVPGGGWLQVLLNKTILLPKTTFSGNITSDSIQTKVSGDQVMTIIMHSNIENKTEVSNLTLNFMTITKYINYEATLHPNVEPNPYTGPIVAILIILPFILIFAWHRIIKPIDDVREQKKPLNKRRIN